MNMMNDGFSLADAMALTKGRDDDCGFNGSSIWILFFFFLLVGGGNFFGNNGNLNNAAVQGALTRSDMFEGFNMNDVNRHLGDINSDIYHGFADIQGALNQNRFDAAKCCCDTNRNIDAIRYENAKNTCDIINAGHQDAQRIIDVFTNDKIQALRDAWQSERLTNSNNTQTQMLISALRPYPAPAYITCSPYESTPLPGKLYAK